MTYKISFEYWELINSIPRWIPRSQRLNMPTRTRLDFKIYCAVDNEFDRTQGQAKFAAGTEFGSDDKSMIVANFTLLSRLS